MDSTVLFGFAKVVGVSLVPVAMMGAAIHARDIAQHTLSLGRRLHLLPPAAAPPSGPPLQKLAADLRRLRPEARSPRPGVPMARHKGIVAAYDGVLVSTARALDVPTTLTELPDGIDREAERLRLEDTLEAADLTWQLRQD